MDQVTIFRHAFEAFSSLSDAQDLMAPDDIRIPAVRSGAVAAYDQINHAKEHLDAIIQSDPETWRQAMLSGHVACSLGKGGDPCR